MTRGVLDTNVLVSSLGWSGPPAAIVDAVTAGELTLLSSPALIAELRRVLSYPKLAKLFANPNAIADLVAAASVEVLTSTQLHVVDDDSDNRVLETALDGGADYIVSGDDDLLSLGSFQEIPIVAPAACLATLANSDPATLRSRRCTSRLGMLNDGLRTSRPTCYAVWRDPRAPDGRRLRKRAPRGFRRRMCAWADASDQPPWANARDWAKAEAPCLGGAQLARWGHRWARKRRHVERAPPSRRPALPRAACGRDSDDLLTTNLIGSLLAHCGKCSTARLAGECRRSAPYAAHAVTFARGTPAQFLDRRCGPR